MNVTALTNAITEGRYDHAIDALKQAINQRSTQLKRASHAVGDTVKIIGPIRPNYLIGHLATVVRVNNNTVTVDFLQPVRGPQSLKAFHKNVRIPIHNVSTVTPSEEKAYRDNLKAPLAAPERSRDFFQNGKMLSLQQIREQREEMRREAEAQRREAEAEMAFESSVS